MFNFKYSTYPIFHICGLLIYALFISNGKARDLKLKYPCLNKSMILYSYGNGMPDEMAYLIK